MSTSSSSSTNSSLPRKSKSQTPFSANFTARELTRLLAYEEREAKDLQRALFQLTDQLNIEKTRADQAEQNYSNALIRIKALNDARLDALRDASRANEELRLYKAQLDVAQKEIFRAQDVLEVVDRQRYSAEEEAAKARSRVRKFHESELVRRAIEEGRTQGLEEGIERGRELGYQQGKRAGYSRGREDVELEFEDDQESSLESPRHRQHQQPRSSSPTSPLNDPPQPPRNSPPRPHPPTPPPEVNLPPIPPPQPSRVSSPTISQRSRPISDIYQLDGWIPEASLEGASSYIHIPAPHNLQPRREKGRSPPLPPLPLPPQNYTTTTTSASSNTDPEPILPVRLKSASRLLEKVKPKERERERDSRRKRRSSSESNSTTISQLDILQSEGAKDTAERDYYRTGGKTPLSVIEEVLSPSSGSRTTPTSKLYAHTGDSSLNPSTVDLGHRYPHRQSFSSSSSLSSSPSSLVSSISTSVSQRLFHRSKPAKSHPRTEGLPRSTENGRRPPSSVDSLATSTNTIGITIQPPSQSSSSAINVNATPAPNEGGYGRYLSPADAGRTVELPPPSPSGRGASASASAGGHSPLYEPAAEPIVLGTEVLPLGFVPVPRPGTVAGSRSGYGEPIIPSSPLRSKSNSRSKGTKTASSSSSSTSSAGRSSRLSGDTEPVVSPRLKTNGFFPSSPGLVSRELPLKPTIPTPTPIPIPTTPIPMMGGSLPFSSNAAYAVGDSGLLGGGTGHPATSNSIPKGEGGRGKKRRKR